MVYRCYTEKREGFDIEAQALLNELRTVLGLHALESVRILCRYDSEGLDAEGYALARSVVFSEPPADLCFDEELPGDIDYTRARILAVEALPGQFDQRSDSCEQCLQMLLGGTRPRVRSASVYILTGEITEAEFSRVKAALINPVEAREASADKPLTLEQRAPEPSPVVRLDGFNALDPDGLKDMLTRYGLAMDFADISLLRDYFRDTERRDPSETELRVIDTYWSDHCRHTTFGTNINIEDMVLPGGEIENAFKIYLDARRELYGDAADSRPVTLMDLATLGAKLLRKRGGLTNLDLSEEVNACSIRVDAVVNGVPEPWLLMFKNETHNHPTEIEPFGGAATCIGGAIRDPLSGRVFVYQAMRVTGAGDPRAPLESTLPGKLPQRRLTQTAAAGYSSYGNQIGLATGLVHEFYHEGYIAKRMEVGAVIGAAPLENVRRSTPEPGDLVLLVGGRTGRDGIGGATGSSKTQSTQSLVESAAEVQKGNAPEERKLQRLFRNPEAARMIKRCNDFGAGGVSVAVGEIADGLDITLDNVRLKYDGLGGTELALSESQERMAVVLAPEDAERFIELAAGENLEAYEIARVTEKARLTMHFQGETIVDISREFLASNGAVKFADAELSAPAGTYAPAYGVENPAQRLRELLADLRWASQRGLGERFDGSIGAGSVIAPFGGRHRLTPAQSMAALLPVQSGECETASVMSFAFDPYHSELDPLGAARDAVLISVAKLVASGAAPGDVYLSFQEYFERLGSDPKRWGKPFSALLGALVAQLELGIAAIGGKDSMSGSFNELNVPPTLISFAVAPLSASRVRSPEFKAAGNSVCLFPAGDSLTETRARLTDFANCDGVLSAWALTDGGAVEGIFKMAVGNGIGFRAEPGLDDNLLTAYMPGAIIAECETVLPGAVLLGVTIPEPQIELGGEILELGDLTELWEAPLEDVFPTRTGETGEPVTVPKANAAPIRQKSAGIASPLAVIPVFPGTNCEYDTARAVERAGGRAEIIVVRNLDRLALEESVAAIAEAITRAQMLILPGGFSGGDEPDGSGKFIASFFRAAPVRDAVHDLLQNRDGLALGICNGFQALIKLGLLPYGEIRPMEPDSPTLTFNSIGRHQAKYVTTRIASNASPWLSLCSVGELHELPVSHGEGRFVASQEQLERMIAAGQIATQYCDSLGNPSMDIAVNPNGSMLAIEGLLSPDGRVFGKMCHSERRGEFVGINIPGNLHQPIFEAGVAYFR